MFKLNENNSIHYIPYPYYRFWLSDSILAIFLWLKIKNEYFGDVLWKSTTNSLQMPIKYAYSLVLLWAWSSVAFVNQRSSLYVSIATVSFQVKARRSYELSLRLRELFRLFGVPSPDTICLYADRLTRYLHQGTDWCVYSSTPCSNENTIRRLERSSWVNFDRVRL